MGVGWLVYIYIYGLYKWIVALFFGPFDDFSCFFFCFFWRKMVIRNFDGNKDTDRHGMLWWWTRTLGWDSYVSNLAIKWKGQCGPPKRYVCWLIQPSKYIVISTIINHSYWSYVHQLSYRKRGPTLYLFWLLKNHGIQRDWCHETTSALPQDAQGTLWQVSITIERSTVSMGKSTISMVFRIANC